LASLFSQRRIPERTQTQLLPQLAGHPTLAKAARPLHHQTGQQHLRYILGDRRSTFAVGEQAQLLPPAILLNRFNPPLPPVHLGRVQFPKMEYRSLGHPGTAHPQTLAERIVNVLLAIFENAMGLQEHARMFSRPPSHRPEGGLSHSQFAPNP